MWWNIFDLVRPLEEARGSLHASVVKRRNCSKVDAFVLVLTEDMAVWVGCNILLQTFFFMDDFLSCLLQYGPSFIKQKGGCDKKCYTIASSHVLEYFG